MGAWNNHRDKSNDLVEQQIQTNNAEIEQSRKDLSQKQFDVIKSQGAEAWYPSKSSGNNSGGTL